MTLKDRIQYVDNQIWLCGCEILFEKNVDELKKLQKRNARLGKIREMLSQDYKTKGGKVEIPKKKVWRTRVLNNNDNVKKHRPNLDPLTK